MSQALATDVLRHVRPGPGPLVYFAHSMLDYKSPAARRGLAVIQAARPGARVLDPSTMGPAWNRWTRALNSAEAVYTLVIGVVDEVIALERDGHVGRGVFCELQEAARRGIPRHVVRGGLVVPVAGVRVANHDDWRYLYGRVELAA